VDQDCNWSQRLLTKGQEEEENEGAFDAVDVVAVAEWSTAADVTWMVT